MQWKGKVVGGLIGAALGAGPVGAVLGLLLGHQFDRQAQEEEPQSAGGDPQLISAVFFRCSFAVMGCVAKSDGRVSERDISAARTVMQQLRLSPEQIQAAIRFFTEGKQSGFQLERAVLELRSICGGRHDLMCVFMEIQLRAALLGNDLQGPARTLVRRVGKLLGVSALELAQIEALLRLQRGPGSATAADRSARVADAYSVLEIEATISDGEVVKAYRRQMSRHHPDKLVANGLPESMMELAKEKTQQIREAYEIIRAHRGMVK